DRGAVRRRADPLLNITEINLGAAHLPIRIKILDCGEHGRLAPEPAAHRVGGLLLRQLAKLLGPDPHRGVAVEDRFAADGRDVGGGDVLHAQREPGLAVARRVDGNALDRHQSGTFGLGWLPPARSANRETSAAYSISCSCALDA